MTKISILVAVYNAERYLSQCLESLCQQTLRDIQIVCIDDCSTDSSSQIISYYASHDPRIVSLRTPQNSGQAEARNLGLSVAEGEYTTMLDADDWYAPDALAQAYQALQENEENDVAVMRVMLYDEATETETLLRNTASQSTLTGEEACRLSLTSGIPGINVVRTSLHKRYPYDTSCRLYSDDNTTRLHYLHARRVVMTDGTYYYRHHAASCTQRCSMRRFDYMEANWSMMQQLQHEVAMGNVREPQRLLSIYETHRWENFVGCYGYLYKHRAQFSAAQHQQVCSRMRQLKRTFNFAYVSPRIKRKFGFWPLRSFFLFRLQLRLYFSIKKHVLGRTVEW